MKIQIANKKMIDDATVIWPEASPDVDMVIDPRPPHGLKFREDSVEAIYEFGILGLTEPKDVGKVLSDFYKILAPKGQLYLTEHDFDYVNRAYLGGDIPIKELNGHFHQRTHLNQEMIVELCVLAGFPEKDMRTWSGGLKFEKKHFEVVLSATKPLLK